MQNCLQKSIEEAIWLREKRHTQETKTDWPLYLRNQSCKGKMV